MSSRESEEQYLETILILLNKKKELHSIEIAKELGYSKPSISVAIKKLKEKQFLTTDTDGHISLTPQGIDMAKDVYEKHKTIFNFLVYIGVNESTAQEDACKIEHFISKESADKLKEFLNKKN